MPAWPAWTPLFRKAVRQDEIAEGAFEAVAAQVRMSHETAGLFGLCLDRRCGSKFRAKDLETGLLIFRDFGLHLDE